jgi:hypothetical protein
MRSGELFVVNINRLKDYDLHDSLIENIHFLKDKQELHIQLEICNWRQANYREGKDELLPKILIFQGVKQYDIQPDVR